MFHHIPTPKFEPSPGANNPEEFLLYNVRIMRWGYGASDIVHSFVTFLNGQLPLWCDGSSACEENL